MKSSVLLATLALVLGSLNFLIAEKEHLLRTGRTVLCELAPVDPRSIMQGDYMVLRYRIGDEAAGHVAADQHDGHLILRLNADDVASFTRTDNGQPLAADEIRVRFRRRAARRWSRGSIQIGADSYFFQEGRVSEFAAARYGELKVADNGECVLVGLRDADFIRL